MGTRWRRHPSSAKTFKACLHDQWFLCRTMSRDVARCRTMSRDVARPNKNQCRLCVVRHSATRFHCSCKQAFNIMRVYYNIHTNILSTDVMLSNFVRKLQHSESRSAIVFQFLIQNHNIGSVSLKKLECCQAKTFR
jgi:hypothetical protein